MPTREGHGDCTTCNALCCRYITIQIDKPTRKVDIDEVRWFLAHGNVEVFIEDGDWYVQVYTDCEHLTPEGRCAIYPRRFDVCRKHSVEDCEASEGEIEAVIFRTTADFDAYLARCRKKRKSRRSGESGGEPGKGRVKRKGAKR